MSRRQGRIIITLDQDYSDYVLDEPRSLLGAVGARWLSRRDRDET
jgi:hypothetical protein